VKDSICILPSDKASYANPGPPILWIDRDTKPFYTHTCFKKSSTSSRSNSGCSKAAKCPPWPSTSALGPHEISAVTPYLIMVPKPHQLPRGRYPRLRHGSQLIREPGETHGLVAVQLKILVEHVALCAFAEDVLQIVLSFGLAWFVGDFLGIIRSAHLPFSCFHIWCDTYLPVGVDASREAIRQPVQSDRRKNLIQRRCCISPVAKLLPDPIRKQP
jgi:hypothetical protein